MATGYGRGMWCTDSLVSGRRDFGAGLVARALYRRLITPRGTLIGPGGLSDDAPGGDEESAYGFDVSAYVGDVGTETAIQALPGLVRGELMKDDRVSDVAVVATAATNAALETVITLEVSGVLRDSGEQFTFTVGVSEVTAEFLGFREAA
jgi:hypothetical protein